MGIRVCRWGIMGTATISQKNWKAIANAENAVLVAVASRNLSRCQEFVDQCQRDTPFAETPDAVEGYEALLQRNDIDAVYIPLPTGIRKEWVIRAAEAGKHVLCEKPCAINHSDLAEMVNACQANNVQFMDGVMYMHSSRMPAIRRVLDDPNNVGEIRRITTQFSFNAPEEFRSGNIRTTSNLEPQGCLGDLGWYTLRFILWTLKWRMPKQVSARMISSLQRDDSPQPVPMQLSAELFFDDVSAGFYCSFETEHQQWANISGTRGYLNVQDYVLPFYGNELKFDVTQAAFELFGCDFVMEHYGQSYAVPEYSNSAANAQETNLFRNFSELAMSGKPDPFWPEISMKTQLLLDACLESALNDGKKVDVDANSVERVFAET